MKTKNLTIGIVIIFIIIGTMPLSISENSLETNNPIPHWIKGGVSYNPNQNMYPYEISIRDNPSSGLIESPPEYGPINGVLFAFKTGHWHDVVADVVVALTQNDDYDEIAYVVVTSQSQMNRIADISYCICKNIFS